MSTRWASFLFHNFLVSVCSIRIYAVLYAVQSKTILTSKHTLLATDSRKKLDLESYSNLAVYRLVIQTIRLFAWQTVNFALRREEK